MGLKGIPKTEEHKRKISESEKGKIVSAESRKKMSDSKKGIKRKPLSDETKRKIGEANRGKKITEETRKKLSDSHIGINSGENHYRWKGGISTENEKDRGCIEYILWRTSVFSRDGYTCQKCYKKTSKNNAHHILNFAQHKELRFAIDNGITLCKDCHKEFHKIYGNKDNNIEQLKNFFNDTLEM